MWEKYSSTATRRKQMNGSFIPDGRDQGNTTRYFRIPAGHTAAGLAPARLPCLYSEESKLKPLEAVELLVYLCIQFVDVIHSPN